MAVWDGDRVLRHRRYKTEPVPQSDGLKERLRGRLAPDRFRGSDEERIEWLRRRVRANIRKFLPKLVVIEGHAFKAQGRGKTVLSELAGVVKNELHRTEIPFIIVPPNTIKAHAGNGRFGKTEMILTAKEFDRTICADDEADAFHAAHYGFEHYDELIDEAD